MTQFDRVSGTPTAFLQTAAKINNKDTLKVCRKITKITNPNCGFFLGDGANLRMKFLAELKNYRFKSIFIDSSGVKNIDTYQKILKKRGEYFVKFLDILEGNFHIFVSIFEKICEKLSEKHEIILRKF